MTPRTLRHALRGGPQRLARDAPRAALALATLLTAFVAWSAVMAPRRYPPMPLGVRRLRLPPGLPPPPPPGTVELVVSRYADDLGWVPELAALLNARVTVYCKARRRRRRARACGRRAPQPGLF
jgi:hypothetical protein